ncbi:uncharacterized protein BO66DRAFT_44764 [Aspergillus aculeatinus CBS 121060]|uniref:Uncharacterized protein n=1 Tax=Aspergillus aculeatinus CBS 121060 TaxID=1448322 RepID=A0ACD1HF48_9EURO|nr:hypothetical protein BO66DRAFT_44764 [Aspergillus aculeatinus CBS 121060]RAH71996.1 hypothetical protein BO66DRAFT_44764 [Aspergillus aculeatinus CBS 121060]
MFVLCVLSYTFLTLLVVDGGPASITAILARPFSSLAPLWGSVTVVCMAGGYGRYIVTSNAIYTLLLPQPPFVSHFVSD